MLFSPGNDFLDPLNSTQFLATVTSWKQIRPHEMIEHFNVIFQPSLKLTVRTENWKMKFCCCRVPAYFPFRFRPIFSGDVLVGGYLRSIATRRLSYFWIRCRPCDAGSCGRMKFPAISSLNAEPTNGTGGQ